MNPYMTTLLMIAAFAGLAVWVWYRLARPVSRLLDLVGELSESDCDLPVRSPSPE